MEIISNYSNSFQYNRRIRPALALICVTSAVISRKFLIRKFAKLLEFKRVLESSDLKRLRICFIRDFWPGALPAQPTS